MAIDNMSDPDPAAEAPRGAGPQPETLHGPTLLEQALAYHKTVEGEYGCPGETCPGVQRLVVFLQSALAAAEAKVSR